MELPQINIWLTSNYHFTTLKFSPSVVHKQDDFDNKFSTEIGLKVLKTDHSKFAKLSFSLDDEIKRKCNW